MSVVPEFTHALKAAQREMNRRLNDAYRPLSLSCVQADVLVALDTDAALTLRGLSELVVAESGNPSRLVDRLVQLGWVDRQRDPSDRRNAQLSLTDAGRDLVGQIYSARAPVLAEIEKEISVSEIARLSEVLRGWALESPER